MRCMSSKLAANRFAIAVTITLAACSNNPANNQDTVAAGNDVDYAYTAAHENTSTEKLIAEIENYDCDGLEEEVCATRIASRELELEERGLCRLPAGGFGNCSAKQDNSGQNAAMTPGRSASDQDAIWKDGQAIAGTCYAEHDQVVLMDGACSGLGHGGSLFVTAEADGCSLDISRHGEKARGSLFAYKNACGELESDVAVGPLVKSGNCWIGDNARFCLKPEDS